MSFDTCKDVWVFIECFQGQPKSVGLELLGQGRKLADGLKQKLCAVVIAKDVDEAVKEAGEYGADKIYVIKGDEYENYSADAYGNGLHLAEIFMHRFCAARQGRRWEPADRAHLRSRRR